MFALIGPQLGASGHGRKPLRDPPGQAVGPYHYEYSDDVVVVALLGGFTAPLVAAARPELLVLTSGWCAAG